MNLLALDTATEACSVVLDRDGRVVSRHLEEPRAHGDRLLELIEEVLEEGGVERADLDAIAFGRGPGGFTSLRIGIGVVQGIAFALDLPVIPVSTLATLAQGAHRMHAADRVVAAIDARMGEIYCGTFAMDGNGIMQLHGPERVIPPDRFERPEEGRWHGCGTGWETYREVLSQRCGDALATVSEPRLPHAVDMLPHARVALARSQTVPPDQAVPVYLRDRVAEKKKGPGAQGPGSGTKNR